MFVGRTLIAACLALCVALPAEVFVQLAKAPALLTHFSGHHHNASGEHADLLELFVLHYGDEAHHDTDDQEHSDLPFSGQQAPVPVTLSPALLIDQPYFACNCTPVQVQHLTHAIDPQDSGSGPSVWQPPKTA